MGPSTFVDFEHHFGDIFETPETRQRSFWYGVDSHPHVHIDGINPVIGAINCFLATEQLRDAIEARIAETGGESPVSITGNYSMTPQEITISATYTLVDPIPLTSVQASLLIYEDNIYWCCGAGGNDTWQRVVRRIDDTPIVLQSVNDAVTVNATIPMDPSWNPDELHVVAYLQDTLSVEIIQGHVVNELPASVDAFDSRDVTRVGAVLPNPARTGSDTAIAFDVSRDAALGPVALRVYDPAGRRVVDLAMGDMTAGHHVVHWDGTVPGGEHARSGLYFVRLETRDGTRTAKLVMLN